MDRRGFLKSLTGLGCVLVLPGCGSKRSQPLRVLFLTDFHAMEERGAPEALNQLAREVNRARPDLVLGGGDCIHGGFSGTEQECETRFGIFKNFVDHIEAPARWLIGNHDFVGAVDESGNVLPGDPTRLFRSLFGLDTLHFTFDYGEVRFICLQSVEVLGGKRRYRGYIDAGQMEWIRAILSTTPKDQFLVLMSHIPLRTTFIQARKGSTEPLPGNLVVENALDVLDLFREHRLGLVLQGHLHTNERITYNHTAFIMAGAVSGAWWQGPNRGTEEGYGDFWISPGTIHRYEYVDYGWQTARQVKTS